MRELSHGETLALRELLQMEMNALAKAEAAKTMITDQELLREAESGILAMKGRVKGVQQFINENNLIEDQEVH